MSDLKWAAHISKVRTATINMIGVLNRFSCALNVNARNKILQVFITSKCLVHHCIGVYQQKGC